MAETKNLNNKIPAKKISKIVFIIWTSAHYHFFKNIIIELSRQNHIKIYILARRFKNVEKLFKEDNLAYSIVAIQRDNFFLKILENILSIFKILFKIIRIYPDLIIGCGSVGGAAASFALRIPSIMFEDDEVTYFQQIFYFPFIKYIIVPEKFRKSFGKKEIRLIGYKELAYLHPNWFKPDKNILRVYGLAKGDKYVVIRLNTWDAYHDIGQKGISHSSIKNLINTFSRYGKVLISTEKDLPEQYVKFMIHDPTHIHHILSYASLLFSDTQTMATEGAILGTPVVRTNSFVGENDMSNFIELEQDYGLMFNLRSFEGAKKKAVELLQQKDIKAIWREKRNKLLQDKIDVSRFLIWFIKNYPTSIKIIKQDKSFQLRFR